jgi:hypothetical protein
MDQAPIDRRASSHHTIGGQFLIRHAEVGGAMAREQRQFLKAAPIHQPLDALARGELASGMLSFGPFRAASELYLGTLDAKLRDHFLDRFMGWICHLIRHQNS